MRDDQSDSRNLKNNPVFVISVAIAIAIVMIVIAFVSYYNSPTRQILEGLQENKRDISAKPVDISKTGPITATDISAISKSIEERTLSLDDDIDYGADTLTDTSLGL